MGDMNDAKEKLRELLPPSHPRKDAPKAADEHGSVRSRTVRTKPAGTRGKKAPHQCSTCGKVFGAVPNSQDAYCRTHPSAAVVRLCARCRRRAADNVTLVCSTCLQARQLAKTEVGGGPDHFGQRKHRAQKHV